MEEEVEQKQSYLQNVKWPSLNYCKTTEHQGQLIQYICTSSKCIHDQKLLCDKCYKSQVHEGKYSCNFKEILSIKQVDALLVKKKQSSQYQIQKLKSDTSIIQMFITLIPDDNSQIKDDSKAQVNKQSWLMQTQSLLQELELIEQQFSDLDAYNCIEYLIQHQGNRFLDYFMKINWMACFEKYKNLPRSQVMKQFLKNQQFAIKNNQFDQGSLFNETKFLILNNIYFSRGRLDHQNAYISIMMYGFKIFKHEKFQQLEQFLQCTQFSQYIQQYQFLFLQEYIRYKSKQIIDYDFSKEQLDGYFGFNLLKSKIQRKKKQFHDAFISIQQAIMSEPECLALQVEKAKILLCLREYKFCIDVCSYALIIDDQETKLHLILGFCYYKMKQYDIAFLKIENANKYLQEKQYKPQYLLSKIFYKLDSIQNAEKKIKESLQTKRKDYSIILKAKILFKKQQYHEIMNRNPQVDILSIDIQHKLLTLLANSCYVQNNFSEALKYYKQVIMKKQYLKPDKYIQNLMKKCICQIQAHEFIEGEETFKEILNYEGNSNDFKIELIHYTNYQKNKLKYFLKFTNMYLIKNSKDEEMQKLFGKNYSEIIAYIWDRIQ